MAFHEETIQSGEEKFMNQLHESRLERVMSAMKDSRLTGLVISDPQSIWYLTGIFNEPYERLFVLYLSADGNHVLFWNKLFNIRQKMFPEVCVCDADDGIRLLPVMDGNFFQTFCICFRREKYLSELGKVFRDFAVEYFKL